MLSTLMRRRLAVTAIASIAATGCSDSPAGPGDDLNAKMMLTASVVGTSIATLVVEVTASDIPTPLVFNLEVENGTATGTLRMPPGDARTITVRAFDSFGLVTHEGTKTVDVGRGQNPPVSIPMVSRAGQQPITVQIGPVAIVLTPPSVTLNPGDTQQFTAVITAPNGETITDSPVWATSNPGLVAVTQQGLATAVGAGSALVVATYAGVAAVGQVSVGALFGNHIEFTGTSIFIQNYLLGQDIQVTQPITLTHFGFITRQGGTNVKIGLYTDDNGQPGSLIVATPATTVVAGRNEVAVTGTQLQAGTYWYMAVYDLNTEIAVGTGTSGTIEYISHAFNDPLPATINAPTGYTGPQINYYLRGTLEP